MSAAHGSLRLAAGGRVDRSKPLRFSFDGRSMSGLAGDTLASALLANGVHLVGRSFKYHRARGLLGAGSEEPNGLVTVARDMARITPNLRATQVELHQGLDATSQNRWPSLAFDMAAVNDRLSPLFPAGFYYKTFMWPPGAWKSLYEPRIRGMAGLGKAPELADPDRYAQRYSHCDVLVVGAGPAGLAAALAASDAGARVVICDEQAEPGGALLAEPELRLEEMPAAAWVASTLAEFGRRVHVRILSRTTAFGYFPHNLVGLAERVTDHLADPPAHLPRERLWQVRAKEVVLATGALERPLVFAGNDRPGVMLASAARAFVNRWSVLPGRRAVLVTAGDEGYRAALDLARAGITIAAIVDIRSTADGALPQAARAAGLPVRVGTTVAGTEGGLRVEAVRTAPIGKASGIETIRCDLVLMAGGWTPSVHLFSQSRGTLRFEPGLGAFLPDRAVERVRCAGAAAGAQDTSAALIDGFSRGAEAAEAAGCRAASPRRVEASGTLAAEPCAFIGALPGGEAAGGKAFVDFQNDVTVKDLDLATQEGFRSIEHVKRYTTTGMATDQGKTSNLNAMAIVAAKLGRSVPEVGHTTFRMPYTPVTFGALAGPSRGQLFDPVRTPPTHELAVAIGGVFEDVAQWKRAHHFPRSGETEDEAVARETRAVREAVGVFDASTLGKIEVVGPDAAEFLNRLYTNSWTKLEPGRCRYGLMLREDGFVRDDGVVGRLAHDRFHVTTTTGGAASVLHLMEDYRQTEWPHLRVWLTSTTEQWAVIAVQGPRARDVVAPLIEGIDMAPAAMPHMSVREGRACGVPTRLMRVSFTGELGYEINVPADHGAAVWEAVLRAGAAHGITPYGTEAMHVLRAEKGYIIVGQESDGTAVPDDLGLAWAVARTKPDFVGKRSLARPAMAATGRKQLVGLLTVDPTTLLDVGAQLVADPTQAVPMTMLGHVTSAYRSATIGRSIALAMLADGRSRVGQTLHVPMHERAIRRSIEVKVVEPVFYDAEGQRLHA